MGNLIFSNAWNRLNRPTTRIWKYLAVLVILMMLLTSPVLVYASEGGTDATSVKLPDESDFKLQELQPGFDYSLWYQQTTGYEPNPKYFGAYVFEPVGTTLYMGFGTARPAESDGALLAGYAGEEIRAIAPLTEQGVVDMTAGGGALYVAGVDPCCGDDWQWGNVYMLRDNNLTKHRNLPNVVHTWGLWFEDFFGVLYASVGAHLGANETLTGGVFLTNRTVDFWLPMADRDDGVGEYRTYDIIGVKRTLYVTWADHNETCGLAQSRNGGRSWIRFTSNQVECRTRLVKFNDKIVALKAGRRGLAVVDSDRSVQEFMFPDFRTPEWAYNSLTVDARGYLYVFAEDGRVMRSLDLVNWETVVDTELELITIAYWPDLNQLILADQGESAKLWKIDLVE